MRRNPRDTEESVRRITRRGLMLGGAQIAFMAVLAGRRRERNVRPTPKGLRPRVGGPTQCQEAPPDTEKP